MSGEGIKFQPIVNSQNKNERVFRVSPERQKIIDELIKFGKENGNELEFIDYGIEIDYAGSPIIKKEVLEKLNEDEISVAQFGLKVLKSYLSGPIFTDSFHENHRDLKNPENPSRVNWEKEKLYNESLSEEARYLYTKNRLAINSNIHQTIGFLREIIDQIKNQNIKKELVFLNKEIPEDLLNSEKYNTLTDSKKIELVRSFSEIIVKVIAIITEKEEFLNKIREN